MVLIAITALFVPAAAVADDGPAVTFQDVAYGEHVPGSSSEGSTSTVGATTGTQYVSVCANDTSAGCADRALCESVDGELSELYDVYVDGEFQHQTCLTGSDAEDPVVTPGTVAAAFRRLSWPASELVIQPPNGRTAVNLDTYFFTPDTAPLTRTVRLLGQRVTIEATPSTFGWRWGDGGSASTTSPGAAYPHGDVVHRYLRTGSVSPSLATTYTGRYRLGDGPWQPIPGTHTVTGPAQDLEVVEVRPTLVSSDS